MICTADNTEVHVFCAVSQVARFLMTFQSGSQGNKSILKTISLRNFGSGHSLRALEIELTG